MGTIQELLDKTKQLSPEQFRTFLHALGIHQENDPALTNPEMQIDGYEKWETQLTHREYILCVKYLQHGLNQARAAKDAGMHAPAANFIFNNNEHVKQFIAQHVSRLAMTPPEMLFHLARMVTLSKADLFNPITGDLDILHAIETGAIEKVKSIRKDERGYQVTFEENAKYLDILTKTAGMQKNLNIHADLRTMALEAGMSLDEAAQHEKMIEEKARLLAELIRHNENVDTIVVE